MNFVAIEKRISVLETLLGVGTSGYNGATKNNPEKVLLSGDIPLVSLLNKLERRLAMLDSTNLEILRNKVNTLRGELEYAVKMKSPLSVENKIITAAKKVEDLSKKLEKVDGVTDKLPELVVRLKTMENVHLSAANFAHKLKEMETDMGSLKADVKSNYEVLKALKDGMAENITIMQNNLFEMEKRLKLKDAR